MAGISLHLATASERWCQPSRPSRAVRFSPLDPFSASKLTGTPTAPTPLRVVLLPSLRATAFHAAS